MQFIDAVSRVHALVSEQAAPKLIYQAVLDGALRLMGGESGALRLVDQADPDWMVAVAFHSTVDGSERSRHRAPITEGMSGRVISTGRPVALENQGALDIGSRMAPPGTRAGIGVPISERGEVIGALVLGTSVNRRWTEHDRKTMSAYGEHVEVALAVARAHHGALGAVTDPLTGLGRHLGLLTVTEGIETQAQRELLETAGCDVGQGFLLGRPSDAAATTRLLTAAEPG